MLKTAIATCLAILATASIYGQAHAVESVLVLRGNATETVSTVRDDNLPTVLRGKVNIASADIQESENPSVAAKPQPIITGGEVLWYFSDDRRRLTACYLRGTGYVGQRRIVCTQRR